MSIQKIAASSAIVFIILAFLGVILMNSLGENNSLYKLNALLVAVSGLWVIGYGVRYVISVFQSKAFGGVFYAFVIFWLILTGFFGWAILNLL